MAELDNPLKEPSPENIASLFTRGTYSQMNGVRKEVRIIPGRDVRVEHGLGFTPSLAELTIRTHLALGDTGTVYMTKEPDEKYIYVSAPRAGKVWLEVSHPPLNSTGPNNSRQGTD